MRPGKSKWNKAFLFEATGEVHARKVQTQVGHCLTHPKIFCLSFAAGSNCTTATLS
jgi:hypothetical protein